ncbi:MAG TPA: type IV secretory system conjugative DNA transfer family protein [Solirubrobacteraceae bacterium]|nr:type IV secretory system conjugative DNA transfer family protein [Solirubrobacteraceae bacterium]
MSRDRTGGPSDAVVLAVIGAVTALGLLVWLWGGVAGTLFGRGWPAAGGLGGVLGVLTSLPSHLSDPAAAWRGAARAELPGAAGCYGALALVAAATALVMTAAQRAGLSSLVRGRDPGARWASRGELRALGGRGRSSGATGRLVLGRAGRRTLYAEQRHALVAFGPPQSGKSAGLAIPALLEWEGPAVASSIKTDLLGATIVRRRALGTVLVFDPFALAGVESHTWSPLGGARTWDGALEVAWRMAAAGELDQKGVEGGDFWAIAAEQRLAPLLYAAAGTGAPIDRVVRWAYGQGLRELDEALAELTGRAGDDEQQLADAHAAYDAVRAFEAQADRTRSSIEATAQGLLRAYRFTRVARSARSCQITADRILDEAATLYLIGDAKASKLLRPIFLALVSEVVDRAYERANANGGRLKLPLLLCLDEAGNVAPLPNLAEIASTAPSHNIQLVSIFHDLAQARSRYAKQAETVVNAHRARMLLPGVADLETLRYFSGLVGEEEAREHTRTTGAGGTTRSSGSRRRRPLIAAEALRQLPDGHALLLYGRLAPVQVRLRMWFTDRRLRRLGTPTQAKEQR